MQVNRSAPQVPVTPLKTAQTPDSNKVHAHDHWHSDTKARNRFIDRAQEAFEEDDLSKGALALVNATVAPGKVGAPGVQVSTFAVDGVQAKDIVLTKRVPPTAEGPNFVLYVPDADDRSFHEFNTLEELTEWVKEHANDPKKLDQFSEHFSHDSMPGSKERVKHTLNAFAEGDINAVVGGYGYEKGDIFTRLDKAPYTPPVPVNGLTHAHIYQFARNGDPTYAGELPNGQQVLYRYDAYGNLHGSSGKKTYYFVRNGLNNDKPLVPMTLKQYERTVTDVSFDNVGANNLSGLFHEFIRQLRNPGAGLATALNVFSVPEDVAHSLEEVVKNPVPGALLQLNQDNRLGTLFEVDKSAMDTWLGNIGNEVQSRIPGYGTARAVLSIVADILETYGPPEPSTDTQVTAR